MPMPYNTCDSRTQLPHPLDSPNILTPHTTKLQFCRIRNPDDLVAQSSALWTKQHLGDGVSSLAETAKHELQFPHLNQQPFIMYLGQRKDAELKSRLVCLSCSVLEPHIAAAQRQHRVVIRL